MKHIQNINDLTIEMPILGTEKYLQCKSNTYGWFTNKIGAIAYYLDIKLTFRRMIFSTNIIYEKNIIVTPQIEKTFLNQLVAYIEEKNICDFIYKAQGNVVFHACPNKATCIPWGTYEKQLLSSESDLFTSFSGKSRNSIRKALKDGIEIKETKEINLVYQNIKQMFERQNSFHFPPLNYLKQLHLSLPNNTKFFLALKKNVIQGSLVLIYDQRVGYAMYAGSIQSPHSGSLDLLHFHAMKFLQDKNILYYDFVGTRIDIIPGSKQEGIDRFKRKFNPSLKKGYAFKVIFNKKKHFLYNLLVHTYFFMKGYEYNEAIDTIKKETLSLIENKTDG